MRTEDIIALTLVVILALSFWKLHRDPSNSFNVFDLVMEGGRLSRIAFVFMSAFAVSSWAVVRLTLDDQLTDAVLIGYGGVFVAPIVAKLFSLPPPAGTVTVSSSAQQTVERTDAPLPPPPQPGR